MSDSSQTPAQSVPQKDPHSYLDSRWTSLPPIPENHRAVTGPTYVPDFGCFFIRSYIFERQDGNAPVLKKMTTCTPSKPNAILRTKQPKARYVPMNSSK